MLSTEWLDAFAPVGVLQADNNWAAGGACVFFRKPTLLWMVTARHVVEKVGRQALAVLVNRSSGEGVNVVELGRILADHQLAWLEDADHDLAAAPMPYLTDYGIRALTPKQCLPLTELVPSMPSFTVGCPYGLYRVNPRRATPLVLDGVISGVDPVSRRIYTTAPTFPGNSGGPLIVHLNQFGPPPRDISAYPNGYPDPNPRLAGIMLETALLPANELAGRIPPLHLGVAAPADAVLALLDSDPARAITAQVESSAPV